MLRSRYCFILGLSICASGIDATEHDELAEVRRHALDVIAIAGHHRITVAEVREHLTPLIAYLDGDSSIERKQLETLEALIDRALIAEEYRRRGGPPISDKEVTAEVQRRKGGALVNLTALGEFYSNHGTSLGWYRGQIEADLILERMRGSELAPRIRKRMTETPQYYATHLEEFRRPERVRLSLIQIERPPKRSEQKFAAAIAQVESVLAAGGKFAAVAKRTSDDSRAKTGGDWGWVNRDAIRAELTAELATMKPGDVRGPIKLPEAWYWLSLTGHRCAGIAPLEEVREEIEQRLAADEEKKWRAEFRIGAKVEILEPFGPEKPGKSSRSVGKRTTAR